MKGIVKMAVVLFCAALPTIYACSQIVPPPPPGGPGGPGGPGPGAAPRGPVAPGGPGERGIQQLVTVQGSVEAYVANDRNEYDGFTLRNSGQTVNVRFAAQMGSRLRDAAKAGSAVSVQGFYETTPEGMNVLHLVAITAGGKVLYDSPPAEPATLPVVSIQSFSGTISELRRDRQGMATGIVLSGNRVIELAPGVYDQLQGYLKAGTAISGSGSPVTPPAGVVMAQNIQMIHPQTLTIDGQTYMVR